MDQTTDAETLYSVQKIIDDIFLHVTEIRATINLAKSLMTSNQPTEPPSYKDCIFEGLLQELENKTNYLKTLDKWRGVLREKINDTENKSDTISKDVIETKPQLLNPNTENVSSAANKILRDQSTQTNRDVNSNLESLKTFVHTFTDCSDRIGLKLCALFREIVSQQRELCSLLDRGGKDQETSKEDNKDFLQTMEVLESVTSVFNTERPIFLKKGKETEQVLLQMIPKPNAQHEQILSKMRITYGKVNATDPPSFVSLTSGLWRIVGRSTNALRNKITLADTVIKVYDSVFELLQNVRTYKKALDELVNILSN
ncbi:unnamed protein product [Calicophoron daubneyi]|uniref:Uncharacterized protein n=1 Tax=Calicophoron daubneyi TaxID=300641 RepID=A0AAV2T0C6_CALDB